MSLITDIAVPFIEGQSVRDRSLAQWAVIAKGEFPPDSLPVFLVREPFDDYYLIVLRDGQSEERDEWEVRDWLRERGATEEQIQKGVDQAWNFYTAIILIEHPKIPKSVRDPLAPKISLPA